MTVTVAPVPSDPGSWDLATSSRLATSMVAGPVLADLADHDPRIAVLTADLAYSNGTIEFARRHPERFVNVGIAEQHMVTMAAGMATFGLVPYVSTFASFIGLLCAEQIRTDLAYPGLPVRIIAHHAGISLGFYGTSHHATEDLGVLRSIAGITVIGPADGPSARRAIEATVDTPGPVYLRVGRGRDPDVYTADLLAAFEVGRMTELRRGDDLAIIANGITVHAAVEASDRLRAEGFAVSVLDAHTVRPFDDETLVDVARRTGRVLVAEEHNVVGGVASACAEAIANAALGGVQLVRAGIPADEYALIGPPLALYAHYRLDADGLTGRARQLLAAV